MSSVKAKASKSHGAVAETEQKARALKPEEASLTPEQARLVADASIENYLRSRNLSEVTRRNRLKWLSKFQKVVGKPMTLASRSDMLTLIDAWNAQVQQGTMRGKTIFTYGMAVKSYYLWVESAFPPFQSPMRGVDIPRGTAEPEKPALTPRQTTQVLEYFAENDPEFYRVLKVAINHGMRVHEILPYYIGKPLSICDCAGRCSKEHDYIFLPANKVRFRVKGKGGKYPSHRWTDPETFTTQEIKDLRKILTTPCCITTSATRKLRKALNRLGIILTNEEGQRFNLGFHIFARHTPATLVGQVASIPTLMKAFHVTGEGWARRYVHPSSETVDEAKRAALSGVLGGTEKTDKEGSGKSLVDGA